MQVDPVVFLRMIDRTALRRLFMNRAVKSLASVVVVACTLFAIGANARPDAGVNHVKATIGKWITDFNSGDFESFISACAPQTAIVDGFPPYAWQTCAEWISDYQANNAALQATHGTLEVGEPIYEEINGNHAYLIYPATFSDTQQGQPVVYRGTWTITLESKANGWSITGSASAWGVNSL
jgi:ketosteroid isomerase-like protein